MMERLRDPLVLVVDDNKPATDLLNTIFRNNGYRVAVAHNGEDAIEIAKLQQPDLILLDVMMPGMDGFEVTQQLQKNAVTEHIPTMLLTARDTPQDIERGFAVGAVDYIAKPFDPRELIARARSKIESHYLRQELEKRTRDLEALLRVSEELNRELDLQTVSRLVLYLAMDLLPSSQAICHRFDEDENLVSEIAIDADGSESTPFLSLDTIQSGIKSSSETVWLWDYENDNKERIFVVSALLHQAGQTHGILTLLSDTPVELYNIRLLEGIARQATMAIRNAQLYELQTNYASMLEKTVAERTAELQSAHKLLVRSEKLASVGRLAAGIAHEINNPLQPILINLELLAEDMANDQPLNVRDVEDTLSSARRITRIVDRLLQFTRKRDDDTPAMDTVSLKSVVENVLSLSLKSLQRDGVEVIVDADEDLVVSGNQDQLEQVVLNLLLNAQAAVGGDGKIQVRLHKDGENAVLEVSDNGSGIPAHLLEQIFEPFITTKDNGTGLGLFISHEIIMNHSGNIKVTSEEGAGSTFKLILPLHAEPANPL